MPKYKVVLKRGTEETAHVDVVSSNEQEAIQSAMNTAADIQQHTGDWDVDSVEMIDEE
jgi:hypothetical protein